MVNGHRVRRSLKARDLQRAARRLSEMEEEALGRPRKLLADAVDAFQAQHAEHAPETRRKYKRVLACLTQYCTQESLRFVDQITVENLDGYALWRNKTNWTWIKEIEILRQFFGFCMEREWTRKNPAKALKTPATATSKRRGTVHVRGNRLHHRRMCSDRPEQLRTITSARHGAADAVCRPED